MKSITFSLIALSFTLIGCTQSEKKIETSENPDGSVTTSTLETQKTFYPDSAKINATVDKAKAKLEVVGEKLDAAAEKTGEKLQEAGENVKDAASKGADRIENSTQKTKVDIQKK